MNYVDKTLKIINSIIENTDLLEAQIDESMSSFNIDSITFIKIIVSLEEAFNFEFDDEMLMITAFPTVRSITKYIEKKVSESCK